MFFGSDQAGSVWIILNESKLIQQRLTQSSEAILFGAGPASLIISSFVRINLISTPICTSIALVWLNLNQSKLIQQILTRSCEAGPVQDWFSQPEYFILWFWSISFQLRFVLHQLPCVRFLVLILLGLLLCCANRFSRGLAMFFSSFKTYMAS